MKLWLTHFRYGAKSPGNSVPQTNPFVLGQRNGEGAPAAADAPLHRTNNLGGSRIGFSRPGIHQGSLPNHVLEWLSTFSEVGEYSIGNNRPLNWVANSRASSS